MLLALSTPPEFYRRRKKKKQKKMKKKTATLARVIVYSDTYHNDHSYSLPPAAAERVPVKRKRTGLPDDPRRFWDRRRSRTRVDICGAFPKWRELRDQLKLPRDADLACFLINSYKEGPAAMLSPPGSRRAARRPNTPPRASPSDRTEWKDVEEDAWETASEDSCSDEGFPSISLSLRH
ncbi:hypothetical protein PFLUV_G00091490 [Perca fluviatilis]|uniref:Uncharacterized protein n=1 Tax=Perca fluviatilis TaxID=8168 RepID=A0A6A5FCM3_PERFL|nr:hypothetical protein PFLUV_G00091490 [Perca fluviatilis]